MSSGPRGPAVIEFWLSATGTPAVVVSVGRSVIDFLVLSDSFDGGYPGTVASRLFAEPWCLGNQTRAALPGAIAPQPSVLDAKPVLQPRRKQQMNKCPGEPSREPCQSYVARFHDGEILAGDGHAALVEVPKRRIPSPPQGSPRKSRGFLCQQAPSTDG